MRKNNKLCQHNVCPTEKLNNSIFGFIFYMQLLIHEMPRSCLKTAQQVPRIKRVIEIILFKRLYIASRL